MRLLQAITTGAEKPPLINANFNDVLMLSRRNLFVWYSFGEKKEGLEFKLFAEITSRQQHKPK